MIEPTISHPAPISVLLADDDPSYRHLLGTLLKRWGYTVEVAVDGAAAWNILQRDDAPHLILLDWMMPEMDGMEVCRRIKSQQHFRSTYVILITANQESNDRVYALESGADDFISKPVNPPELLARVRVGTRIIEYQRKLETMALEDSLTGLSNRRAYQADVERLISTSVRHEHAFGLAIIDVNHFKQINDVWGHDVGDAVLHSVAQALKTSFRTGDRVYRLGGDEFAVLLPEIDGPDGIPLDALQTRIISQLRKHPVESHPDIQPSLSVGVASFSPDAPCTGDDLYRLADQRMYEDKCRHHQHAAKTRTEGTS